MTTVDIDPTTYITKRGQSRSMLAAALDRMDGVDYTPTANSVPAGYPGWCPKCGTGIYAGVSIVKAKSPRGTGVYIHAGACIVAPVGNGMIQTYLWEQFAKTLLTQTDNLIVWNLHHDMHNATCTMCGTRREYQHIFVVRKPRSLFAYGTSICSFICVGCFRDNSNGGVA